MDAGTSQARPIASRANTSKRCSRSGALSACLAAAIVIFWLGSNFSYVYVYSSPAFTQLWKKAAHWAIGIAKALQNAVLLPLLARLCGRGRLELWMSLLLRVANKVVVPVLLVLFVDQRCLAGVIGVARPVPGTVTIEVFPCVSRVDNIVTNASGGVLSNNFYCKERGTLRFHESVTFSSPFTAACGSAVVETYGSVVTLSMLWQAGVILGVRLAWHVWALRLRRDVDEQGLRLQTLPRHERTVDGRWLRWLAFSVDGWAPACRALSAWTARPWHRSQSSLASLWIAVVTSVAVMLAWGTVYPVAMVAAWLWLLATWLTHAAMLRAEEADWERVCERARKQGDSPAAAAEIRRLGVFELPPRWSSAHRSRRDRQAPRGGLGTSDPDARPVRASRRCRGRCVTCVSNALTASLDVVEAAEISDLMGVDGVSDDDDGGMPVGGIGGGEAGGSDDQRDRTQGRRRGAARRVSRAEADRALARRVARLVSPWQDAWGVWLVPLLTSCAFHAFFFSLTGAYRGTAASWGRAVLPVGCAVVAAAAADCWSRRCSRAAPRNGNGSEGWSAPRARPVGGGAGNVDQGGLTEGFGDIVSITDADADPARGRGSVAPYVAMVDRGPR